MEKLRFALIADTHYWLSDEAKDSSLWNMQLFSRTEELGELLRNKLAEQSLDFIIHNGDLTHEGDLASLEFARDVFGTLKLPVFCTPGNHDIGNKEFRNKLPEFFPQTRLDSEKTGVCYTVKVGPINIIFVDTNFALLPDNTEDCSVHWKLAKDEQYVLGPSAEGVTWLENELEKLNEQPALIVSHHPFVGKEMYPRRLPREFIAPEFRLVEPDIELWARNHQQVRKILSHHAFHVKALFAGHWHINDQYLWRGIPAIQTCSLTEFPFEYRLFELKGHELVGKMHKIGDQDLDALSLVPEWHNEWQKGEDADRDIVLRI